jgi:alkanesulfonate monooxygenase SsuD/methylene tetrahydromethanopterin reductase-like flavin-dependent oxidoreductase (luciferase family)
VWLGEHHFTDDGFAPSLMTIAAAIAVATTRVQIGTHVLLLPQHHPVRLAEDAAVVDILSNGRLILGMGLGYRPSEFEAVGLDYHARGDVMDEYLEVLVRCFTEDSFSFEGRYVTVRDVALSPKPVQTPMPRLVLGGSGERMLRRAARFGCSGLALSPTADILHRHGALVAAHGGDADTQRYYGMAMGFVADTDDEAWKLAQGHATWELDHYNAWFAEAGLPKIFPNGPREDFVIGTPQRWVDTIGQRHPSPLRCDHLIVELNTCGMAHNDAMRGIELFADQVLPQLHAL